MSASNVPAKLAEIIDDFQDLTEPDRLQLLLDFSRGLPALPERYTEQTAMNPHELVDAWRGEGKPADFIPSPDDIVARLTPELNGGEVILVMSNGGFGGIHQKLLDALAG